MPLVKWPDSLPLPLLKGHGIKRKSGIKVTKMESGYARYRRAYKTTPSSVPASFVMSDNELAICEGFLEHYLNGGVDWFLMPVKLPIGLIDSETRIVADSFSCKAISNKLWTVSLKLEIRDKEIIDAATTDVLIAEGADALVYSNNILKRVYKK